MHLGLGRYRLGVGMRRPGFEPGLWAWKAQVIPLDHRRTFAPLSYHIHILLL